MQGVGTHREHVPHAVLATLTRVQASSAIQSEMSAAAAEGRSKRGEPARPPAPASGARYSRLDSDIAAMQRDSATYCDEPEDSDGYAAWLQVPLRAPGVPALHPVAGLGWLERNVLLGACTG